MTLTEFERAVLADGALILRESDVDNRAFLVESRAAGAPEWYTVLYEAVEAHDWETLRAVLLGLRHARELIHVSRIVGYFSRVENWNRSKIAELRARRRGNYTVQAVPEPEPEPEPEPQAGGGA